MKLFKEYLLVDRDHKLVLRFGTNTSTEHMQHMRNVYACIYERRTPLHIAAVDALGELHVLEIGDEADQPL